MFSWIISYLYVPDFNVYKNIIAIVFAHDNGFYLDSKFINHYFDHDIIHQDLIKALLEIPCEDIKVPVTLVETYWPNLPMPKPVPLTSDFASKLAAAEKAELLRLADLAKSN